MPVEMGLWRVDDKPVRLLSGGMPTEARLEELIEAEPTIGFTPCLCAALTKCTAPKMLP